MGNLYYIGIIFSVYQSSLKGSSETIYVSACGDLFMCVPDLRRGFGLIRKVHTKSNFPGSVFNL